MAVVGDSTDTDIDLSQIEEDINSSSSVDTTNQTPPSTNTPTFKGFTYIRDPEGWKCDICGRKLKRDKTTNSNLKKHIQRVHSLKPNPDQPKLETVLGEGYAKKITQSTLLRDVILSIVANDLSFRVVENEEFKSGWMKCKPSNLSMPTRKQVSDGIDTMFELEKARVKSDLQNAPGGVSLVLDSWQSSNFVKYVGYIASYIDHKWEMQLRVMDYSILSGSHTGERLADMTWEVMQEFGITKKLISITTDNASNMTSMMSKLASKFQSNNVEFSTKDNHIRCAAHVMNLAVQQALTVLQTANLPPQNEFESRCIDEESSGDEEEDSSEEMDSAASGVYSKIRNIVSKVRHSTEKKEQLERCCEFLQLPKLILKIDVKIRWNSTLDMLERALRLREAIDGVVLKFPDLKDYLLSSEEWKQVERFVQFLEPFKQATLCLSQQKIPLLADAVSTFMFLFDLEEKHQANQDNEANLISVAWRLASSKLEEYLPKTGTFVQRAGIVLDPRCKLQWYENAGLDGEVSKTKDLIKNYWIKKYKPSSLPTAEEGVANPMDIVGNLMMKKRRVVYDELDTYLNEEPVQASDGLLVLKWWKDNEFRFPNLSKFARDILPALASSVPIENKFSGGPDILKKRRVKLSSITLKKLLCLKSWRRDDTAQMKFSEPLV